VVKLRVLDLFSGIGGFSLGLERTGGFETVAFCEIEKFPRRVLAKHWPEVPCYNDVRKLTAARLAADGITGINVITGGFPCQDLSVAGKQRGMGEGTRSGLWSEIVRLTRELRPDYVIVENVAALLAGPSERRGGWFGRVLGDLAECGYDAEWENIPASALGAWHERQRVWLVCYPCENAVTGQLGGTRNMVRPILATAERVKKTNEFDRPSADVSKATSFGQPQSGPHGQPIYSAADWDWEAAQPFDGCLGRFWESEPSVDRVANGVPSPVDRLAALGNAVVPQIPELIGHAILQSIRENQAT
jgi:DNA (cytosine-5)-methyltransferase 1